MDYAAATPVDDRVMAAMQPFLATEFYNPSAAYMAALAVREKYEEARHDIAKVIGAVKAEIIMTAGATESINLALRSFEHVLTTAIEHPAVLGCVGSGDIVNVDGGGRVDLADLRAKITDATELISVGYANSEIGVVQPIKEIARIVQDVRADRLERGVATPIYFHTDASAAAGMLELGVARLGVDMMTLNAGKCYGPKQVGCLYVRAGVKLRPAVCGGGQEMGLRSGTENVAGAIGFAAALKIAEKKRKVETVRLGKMRDDLERYLIGKSNVKDAPGKHFRTLPVKINGDCKHRLPNILNFSIPGLDGERAVFALDFAGVMVATGSACAANKGLRSHVLTAIGLDDRTADGSIRSSLGRGTTREEMEETKKILAQVLPSELALSQE